MGHNLKAYIPTVEGNNEKVNNERLGGNIYGETEI
jgi:hypothetical protein